MDKIEKLQSNIRALDYRTLTEQGIIRIICDFGLVRDAGAPPEYGPNYPYGEWLQFMNKSRAEIGVYQTPGQIAPAILELLKHEIKSYVEIGIFSGGNFILTTEFLKLREPYLQAIAIDITDQYMEPWSKKYVNLHLGTSKDFIGRNGKTPYFDCVMIDGDHQYHSVKEDWENLGQYAKICMIHDIQQWNCPGVIRFWNEIKQGRKTMEFRYMSPGLKQIQGIGMIFNL